MMTDVAVTRISKTAGCETRVLRNILTHMRNEGCGGEADKVELLTGVDGASSRPVRRIVLRG
jgi:hypothetical protein